MDKLNYRRVWRYELDVTDEQEIEMPIGARFLGAEIHCHDFQKINIWVEVPSAVFHEGELKSHMMHTYRFMITGTGRPVWSDHRLHLSTVVDRKRSLVWHLYQLPNKIGPQFTWKLVKGIDTLP